ncbi:hypothetical protein SLS62_011009 [Diatrype stigma]|uniref:Uncharacterized protein n=1 Tax=Diatrype stigma TaxID=117547 RepID=A0AAN9UDJ2_9PEZI
MRFSHTLIAAAVATSPATAQRPEDEPICDYYTTALLKENTAENQLTLLTLIVNTVVIGNYTTPNVGIAVPGILAPGKYNDTDVNLLPYFDGSLASSNRGGDEGVAVNSLDGGGAEPLKENKPSNDETATQYFLLTHLYQFFGSLLGCTQQGMAGFDAYTAAPSMYEVHKFMGLDPYEVGYFITQVGLAAASFGVADADVAAVGAALTELFAYRCAPPAAAVAAQGPQLQSVCIAEDCPLAEGAVCDEYEDVVEPMPAMSSDSASAPSASGSAAPGETPAVNGSVTMSMPTPTASETDMPSMIPTAAAVAGAAVNLAAVAGGLAALLL